jgi:transcriptional regulator with XRE-family HTH domain
MIAAQCRAARGLLNMTVKELAARARVATDTIVRLENGRDMKPRTLDAIRMALEAAGVEFLPAGVRLKFGPRCGWDSQVDRPVHGRLRGQSVGSPPPRWEISGRGTSRDEQPV